MFHNIPVYWPSVAIQPLVLLGNETYNFSSTQFTAHSFRILIQDFTARKLNLMPKLIKISVTLNITKKDVYPMGTGTHTHTHSQFCI